MHPERVPGHPEALRWRLPEGTLAHAGTVVDAPGLLGLLLQNPRLCSVETEPGGATVLMRFTDEEALRTTGPVARRALQQALPAAARWDVRPSRASGEERDRLVRTAAEAVLAGSLGEYVHSHAGRITLLGVVHGVLELQFRGTCRGCPLSRVSLRGRIEREVRMRCPELAGVRIR
jgi:Fe/S biogenesis protein NfuA